MIKQQTQTTKNRTNLPGFRSKMWMLFFATFCVFKTQATVYYAKPSATGTGTGLSWANASTLADALNTAASGDDIWVMQGTHLPTRDASFNASPADTRFKTFAIKSGVQVYGGFVGTETLLSQRSPSTNITILSGDIGTASDNTDNSYNVVYFADNTVNTTILEGFTITAGNANVAGSFRNTGGGVFIRATANAVSPQLIRCIITGNNGTVGAGMYVANATPTINRCVFANNTATSTGGGIHVVGNSTTLSANVSFTNTVIAGNIAPNGAGYYNTATGGGTADATLNFCTIQGNNATTGSGGGFYNNNSSSTANMAINNSIAWGNAANLNNTQKEFYNSTGTGSTFRTVWDGGVPTGLTDGGNNLSSNPLFTSIGNADGVDDIWATADDGLRLQCASPAIEAANPAATLTLDILGNSRPLGTGNRDCGAYETENGTATITSTASISITTGTNPVCQNGSTTFTASGTNVGLTPTYQWKRNGADVGTNSNTYSPPTSSVGSANIACQITSSNACSSPLAVLSSSTTFVVSAPATPYVTVTGPGTACAGSIPTYTANPTDGGTGPTYQWTLNGNNISGATNSTYAATAGVDFYSGQVLNVKLTAGTGCVAAGTYTSPNYTIPALNQNSYNPTITLTQTSGVTNQPIYGLFNDATNGFSTVQWKRNSTNLGTSFNQTFSTIANNDVLSVTSSRTGMYCFDTNTVSRYQTITVTNEFTHQTTSIPAVYSGKTKFLDYNNDGFNDICVTGADISYNPVLQVWVNNGTGAFTQVTTNLPPVLVGEADWADYDKDGDLDVLITGTTTGSTNISQLWRNDGSNTFTNLNLGLTAYANSGAKWIDFDNDGDLDFFYCGYTGSAYTGELRRNDGGNTFTVVSGTGINEPFNRAAITIVDYNKDGFKDIAICGGGGSVANAILWKNNGNSTFTNDNSSTFGNGFNGNLDFADFNSDGFVDAAVSGAGGIKLFTQNSSGIFSLHSTLGTHAGSGGVRFFDYDNDGDADALTVGAESGKKTSNIYANNGSGTFTATNIRLNPVDNTSINVGFLNNDDKVDVFYAGLNQLSALQNGYYQNFNTTVNTAPSIPINLAATINNCTNVTLSWQASTDATTPQSQLQYRIKIGTTNGGTQIAETVVNNTNYTITGLAANTTYYFAVLAIDNGNLASAYSTTAAFSNTAVTPGVAIAITTGTNPACSTHSITYTATPTHGGTSPAYQWTKNGVNISGATNATYTAIAGTDFVSTDIIRCVLTSNATCVTASTATSTGITMTVNPSQSRLYVKANATGSNNGTSWTDAYTDLQSALNTTCLAANAEIWVAAGTYKPTTGTDRTIYFNVPSGRKLYGGFAGTETLLSQRPSNLIGGGINATILSGDIGTPSVNTDNTHNLVRATNCAAGTVFDGFTVQDAFKNNGNYDAAGFTNKANGANHTISITNCVFKNNVADVSTLQAFGAMLVYTQTAHTTNVSISNCVFANNNGGSNGGAIYAFSSNASSTTNCTVNNTLFYNNTAEIAGAISYRLQSGTNGTMQVNNSTFVQNTASAFGKLTSWGSVGTFNINNAIIWDNAGSQTLFDGVTPNITYSNIQQTTAGTGNINSNPNFVNPTDPDGADNIYGTADDGLALQTGSPSINTGTNTGVSSTDIIGAARTICTTTDMGAYENIGATRLYVKANATGANNGTSWNDAYTDLQSALNTTCFAANAEIWVAQGTYKPTNGTDRTLYFNVPNNVKLYGGFVGTETAINQRPAATYQGIGGVVEGSNGLTILSGDIGTANDSTDNSYHVIVVANATAAVVIDGFTLTKGNANSNSTFLGGLATNDRGAGLYAYNNGSNLTLAQLTFTQNTVTGGGAYFNSSTSPSISQCVWQQNSSVVNSGSNSSAILTLSGNLSLSQCSFIQNNASGAGTIRLFGTGSTQTFSKCLFNGNTAQSESAGINSSSSMTIQLSQSVFVNNSAVGWGGAVRFGAGTQTVDNCVFANNTASSNGGAVFTGANTSIRNSVFYGNSATLQGGAIQSNTNATISNCIIYNNTAPTGAGIHVASGTPVVEYSNVQGGFTGTGNINANPNFVNENDLDGADNIWGTADDGLQLLYNSPSRNTGNNTGVSALDITNATRVVDATVDMGAYENPTTTTVTPSVSIAITTGNNPTCSGSSITFTATPTNGGVSPTYQWTKNSVNIAAATNATYTGIAGTDFVSADVIACTMVSNSPSANPATATSNAITVTVTTPITRLYVNTNATGLNNGTSWANAFTDLQSALNTTCFAANAEIWVAAGTYKPSQNNNRNETFNIPSGVKVYGGFAGTETALNQRPSNLIGGGINATILSGDIGTPSVNTDNTHNLVRATNCAAGTVFDGFTVQDAFKNNGNYDAAGFTNKANGANHTISITNCVFKNNVADVSTLQAFGAMLVYTQTAHTTNVSISNCVFANNNGGSNGGAIYAFSSNASSTTNCTVNNTLFYNNTAEIAGAISYRLQSGTNGTMQVNNSTFVQNTASAFGKLTSWGSVGTFNINNAIIWDNAGSQTLFDGVTPNITYSNIQQTTAGTGNINSNPNFVNPTDPDGADNIYGTADDGLALQTGSPSINTGTNTGVSSTDIIGAARTICTTTDMGAYENIGATRLYVKANATGANNGTSWNDAYTDLQSALNTTCFAANAEIWVAQGTYKPTNGTDRTLYFNVPNNVKLYGGFVGTETAINQRPAATYQGIGGVVEGSNGLTILSGDIGTANDSTDNSYHVIVVANATAAVVIDGFTLTKGNANSNSTFLGGLATNDRGAGLYAYNNGSNLTLAQLTFTQNTVTGGGAYFNSSTSPSISQCVWQQNSSVVNSGSNSSAILTLSGNLSLSQCSFIQNNASGAGTIRLFGTGSTQTFSKCLFNGNTAQSESAGINSSSSMTIQLSQSVFVNNSAVGWGGAVRFGAGTQTVDNCVFANNTASSNGGAVFTGANTSIRNSVFYGNSATLQGGAIQSNTNATISNCIIYNNTAPTGAGIHVASGTPVVEYSNVQGGFTGTGNINANPNFVNENDLDGADNIWGTADDGLQLQPNSPSINSGNNTGASATDLAGNTRIQNTTIDMGAYEKGINQWTGAFSTAWETTGNWSNNVLPTNSEEAYIVPTANQPIVTTGQALNVSLASGATLTISGTLSCAGAIHNLGTIHATTGTLVLNGVSLQTLWGGVFSNNTLANLTINNAAGVLLTDTLKITDAVNPQLGTLNTANKLVLVSNLSFNGKILAIQPTADVAGNVTIQRYMIGGVVTQRGWRSMSSPISNFNYTQLVDDILVSGPGGATNGFDHNGTPSSIIHYQESTTGTRGWKDIANITATQDAGKGSMVFFRGDRTQTGSLLNFNTVPNNVTMAFYGNINKGNIATLPLSYTNTGFAVNDGWNLMGNPYPCPINYGAINKTSNVSNSFWVLNPVTGNYVNQTASENIAISQGFFVQVNDLAQSMSFEEVDKVNTSPTQYFKTVVNPFAIKMYSDSIRYDVAWLSFENTASKNYVFNQDAMKFTNNLINLSFITPDSQHVQRNVCQTLNTNSTDTFVISTQALNNGNYWLIFEETASLPATKNAFLVDLFTNNWINIKTTPSYSYTINNSTPASFGKRFLLILTDQHTSLPLSLLSFTGTKQQRNAQLNWSTASEKNSSHFVVQKSTDNVNWQNIGTVKAKGNSSITNNYSLTDFNAFTNQYLSNPNSQIPTLKSQLLTIYYRLQMVDKDNGHAYSHAIVLTDDMPQAGIALMPNPASNNVQIHINSLAQLLDVKVFDAKGAEATIALQGLQMDVSYLAAGVYMVQVLTTQGTQHIKLIKQ